MANANGATASAQAPLLNDNANEDVEAQTTVYRAVGYRDIAANFIPMGWTAFGGPQAHIGMFERTFIAKQKWMSSTVFMELFALCSCLPGPTSTQMSFALGAMKKGIFGGLLGGALFQFPGLAIMSLCGVGAAQILQHEPEIVKATVDGLAAVGVALVASAAKGLVTKQCSDRVTTALCVASAIIAYIYHASWLFPVLILGGGLVTFVQRTIQGQVVQVTVLSPETDGVIGFGLGHVAGALLLLAWAVILFGSGVARAVTDYSSHWVQPLHWFESFFRVGSLIYGGGQVVLPLLLQEVVQYNCTVEDGHEVCRERADSWITSQQFGAGLAIIQAMPGPMFNLAAYLGAVIAYRADWNWAIGVAACWLGLMGSGIMLMYGVLPFWGSFRSSTVYRRALPGFNAAAVGLVITAVFDMYTKFTSSSVFPKISVAIGIIGFSLIESNVAAPLTITLGGVLGASAYQFHIRS